MTPFSIRCASTEDIPVLLDLVEQYWQFEQVEGFSGPEVEAALSQLLQNSELGQIWVAVTEDGDTIGYLSAVYVFSLEHKGMTAEIDELFVVPGTRSQGVGNQLLHEAEALFQEKSITNASLQIGKQNTQAQAFYLRHGFKIREGFGLLEKDY